MKKINRFKPFLTLSIIFLLLISSCSNDNEAVLDYSKYEVDLSQPYVDLSNDLRFKNLTREQIRSILKFYSTNNTKSVQYTCNNCVAYVRERDYRLMPLKVCDNKWTTTNCLAGKQALLNRATPVAGAAVVMENGESAGHVGFVETVVYLWGGKIDLYVANGNWNGGCKKFWMWSDDSRIYGYQDPNWGINCDNEFYHTCD